MMKILPSYKIFAGLLISLKKAATKIGRFSHGIDIVSHCYYLCEKVFDGIKSCLKCHIKMLLTLFTITAYYAGTEKNEYINEWITTQKTMECKLIQ